MGPIFPSPGSPASVNNKGNVFFIASHDKFDGDTGDTLYEYHEMKGSLESGYMFGLFSLKNASWTDI